MVSLFSQYIGHAMWIKMCKTCIRVYFLALIFCLGLALFFILSSLVHLSFHGEKHSTESVVAHESESKSLVVTGFKLLNGRDRIPARDEKSDGFLHALDDGNQGALFRVDVQKEIDHATAGDPCRPLSRYKNPCWFSSLYPAHIKKEARNTNATGETSRLRCLPFAFIAGVSKCGTSDLFYKIGDHPEVSWPMYKEPGFWNRRRVGVVTVPTRHEAIMSLTSYIDTFNSAAQDIQMSTREEEGKQSHHKITVDGTPFYLWDYEGWDKVPVNEGLKEPRISIAHSIHRLLPESKIIVILRNPVERLYSQFRQFSSHIPAQTFHEWSKDAIRRFHECTQQFSVRSCAYNASINPHEWTQPGGVTLRAGLYHIFLRDWLEVFPKRQVLILHAEEYYRDRKPILNRAYRFLGLKELNHTQFSFIDKKPVVNSKTFYKRSMEPMLHITRHMLEQFYQPFNVELSEFLMDDRFKWE